MTRKQNDNITSCITVGLVANNSNVNENGMYQ